MNFSSSSPQLRISGSVREIVKEDGAVLLDIKQGLCFSINPAGTRIWEMVKKGCSVGKIEEALQSEFEVSRAQIEDDVRDFIQNLITAKLVSTAPKEGAEAARGKGAGVHRNDETEKRRSTNRF